MLRFLAVLLGSGMVRTRTRRTGGVNTAMLRYTRALSQSTVGSNAESVWQGVRKVFLCYTEVRSVGSDVHAQVVLQGALTPASGRVN